MKFIKKHKTVITISVIAVLILAITIIALSNFLFSGYGKSKYGNRLDGIENVSISDDIINASKEIISNIEGVTNVTYHLSGKICNFVVTVNKDVKLTIIKEKTSSILTKFSTEQLAYYDFQILVNSSEDANYPIIGYKMKNSEGFTWTGKVVSNEE